MTRSISSRWTFYYKFVFPTVWLGGFSLAAIFLAATDWRYLLFLGMLVLAGGFVFLTICFPLKRVEIDESYLYVCNYFKTARTPLSEVEDVRFSWILMSRPRLAWIKFKNPTGFGKEIVFMPKREKKPILSPHSVVDELKAIGEPSPAFERIKKLLGV